MDDAEMHRPIVEYGVRVLGVTFRAEHPDSPILRSLANDGVFARKVRERRELVLRVHVRRSQGGIYADKMTSTRSSGVAALIRETCMIA